MFDNYTPEAMAADGAALKARFPHIITEGSGVRFAGLLVAFILHVKRCGLWAPTCATP